MLDVAGYFVVLTNLCDRRERINVQHVTFLYYDSEDDRTKVTFINGKTRHYKGNVVAAITQDCVVHIA